MIKNVFTALFTTFVFASSAHGAARRGGGSDGGGNSYKGKPLESYARDPYQLVSFNQVIVPILQDLERKDPDNSRNLTILKSLMESVFSKKIWYFVPGPLSQVPEELLNSAVRTDQAALQSFDRVWIDEDIWRTMRTPDQGRLLLHEIFMGLKILRFSNARLCAAAYPQERDCSYEGNFDERIVLESKDYVDIQKMTIQVSNRYRIMTSDDWVKMIRTNGLLFSWDWFDEIKFIDKNEFGKMISQSKVSNYLPTFGYNFSKIENSRFSSPEDRYEMVRQVKEPCRVSVDLSRDSLSLKLSSDSTDINLSIPLKNEIETVFKKDLFSDRLLQTIGMDYPTGRPGPHGGFQNYIISLGFDGYDLVHIFVQEMICEKPNCEDGFSTDLRGGATFLCYDSGEIFKP